MQAIVVLVHRDKQFADTTTSLRHRAAKPGASSPTSQGAAATPAAHTQPTTMMIAMATPAFMWIPSSARAIRSR